MKKIVLLISIFIGGIMNANAANVEGKHIQAMMFLVAPVSDDDSTFKAVVSVCECTLSKAKQNWSNSEYLKFTEELGEINSPFSKKSEEMKVALKKLIPYIEECEEIFNTRVEF